MGGEITWDKGARHLGARAQATRALKKCLRLMLVCFELSFRPGYFPIRVCFAESVEHSSLGFIEFNRRAVVSPSFVMASAFCTDVIGLLSGSSSPTGLRPCRSQCSRRRSRSAEENIGAAVRGQGYPKIPLAVAEGQSESSRSFCRGRDTFSFRAPLSAYSFSYINRFLCAREFLNPGHLLLVRYCSAFVPGPIIDTAAVEKVSHLVK